jgi:beta-lactam-binding protein with PASTA domain
VTASTAPAQPVKTVTVSTTPSPSSPTGASTEKASQGNTDWVMPNEVGEVLQDAQDAIQGVTDNPFFYTASHDALGKARFQVLDRDWQVCSQSPSAGTSFNQDTDITFDVVKLWEDCP